MGQIASRTALHTLIARWTGSTWTRVASPSPGSDDELSAAAFSAPGNGWAVGSTGWVTAITVKTLILHWDGKTWS